MIMVSACLAGTKCRYNGQDRANNIIVELKSKDKVVEVCPEIIAGFSTPRLPCEIVGGTGVDVINGQAIVVNNLGEDITQLIVKGCYQALESAKNNKIKLAVMKSKSVCCGAGQIYDGTFSRRLIPGDGILTVLLKQQGIKVLNSEQFSFVEQLKKNKNISLG
ncbi:MAG: DUF523 domain-containing protein [Candidatus Omnitrophica bacterium]|nr:DUF523 domain-containing protein [Candidatus Omnitrophota bacterium]